MSRLDELEAQLNEMHDAAGGVDNSRSYEWSDKPHRLVYDATRIGLDLLAQNRRLMEVCDELYRAGKQLDAAWEQYALGSIMGDDGATLRSEMKPLLHQARTIIGGYEP